MTLRASSAEGCGWVGLLPIGANLNPRKHILGDVIVARSLRSRLNVSEHSSRDRRERATIKFLGLRPALAHSVICGLGTASNGI